MATPPVIRPALRFTPRTAAAPPAARESPSPAPAGALEPRKRGAESVDADTLAAQQAELDANWQALADYRGTLDADRVRLDAQRAAADALQAQHAELVATARDQATRLAALEEAFRLKSAEAAQSEQALAAERARPAVQDAEIGRLRVEVETSNKARDESAAAAARATAELAERIRLAEQGASALLRVHGDVIDREAQIRQLEDAVRQQEFVAATAQRQANDLASANVQLREQLASAEARATASAPPAEAEAELAARVASAHDEAAAIQGALEAAQADNARLQGAAAEAQAAHEAIEAGLAKRKAALAEHEADLRDKDARLRKLNDQLNARARTLAAAEAAEAARARAPPALPLPPPPALGESGEVLYEPPESARRAAEALRGILQRRLLIVDALTTGEPGDVAARWRLQAAELDRMRGAATHVLADARMPPAAKTDVARALLAAELAVMAAAYAMGGDWVVAEYANSPLGAALRKGGALRGAVLALDLEQQNLPRLRDLRAAVGALLAAADARPRLAR